MVWLCTVVGVLTGTKGCSLWAVREVKGKAAFEQTLYQYELTEIGPYISAY